MCPDRYIPRGSSRIGRTRGTGSFNDMNGGSHLVQCSSLSSDRESALRDSGIPRNMLPEQREEIERIFEQLDSQNRGYITFSGFEHAMVALGFNRPSTEQIELWAKSLDPKGIGKIKFAAFSDFVGLQYDEIDQIDQMKKAFRLFKSYNSIGEDIGVTEDDCITFEDLKRVCGQLNESVPDDELHEMINMADSEGDGKVYFDDFVRIMRKTGLF